MNLATVVALVVVIMIVSFAAWRTYHMVKNHDSCAFCPRRGSCHKNPINCVIRQK